MLYAVEINYLCIWEDLTGTFQNAISCRWQPISTLILDRVTRPRGEGVSEPSRNPLPTFLLHLLPISPEWHGGSERESGVWPFLCFLGWHQTCGLESPELTLFELISLHPFLTLCFESICLLFNESHAGYVLPVPPCSAWAWEAITHCFCFRTILASGGHLYSKKESVLCLSSRAMA